MIIGDIGTKKIIMGTIDKIIGSEKLNNNLKEKEKKSKNLFRKIFKISKETGNKELTTLLLDFESENINYTNELSEFYYDLGALSDEIINY